MDEVRLVAAAPCKINLSLKVLGRRPDGYHNLESVFALLEYGDAVEIAHRCTRMNTDLGDESASSAARTTVAMLADAPQTLPFAEAFAALPPEKNLVCRAAELWRAETGFAGGLDIAVKKRIPPGSGLGGGSSDAAAALLGLDALAPRLGVRRLAREKLFSLGAALGSDVPFFVSAGLGEGTAAFVSGRGEIVEPLPGASLADCAVLLVFPGFESSTASAFARLDEERRVSHKAHKGTKEEGEIENHSEISVSSVPPCAPCEVFGTNDFQEMFLSEDTREAEIYRNIIASLKESGALFAGVSGSGSACFGIFEQFSKISPASEHIVIRPQTQFFTKLTKFLANT
jgi:4-diphosphocytidyl-2-C-methyl-D-erythritol kinase